MIAMRAEDGSVQSQGRVTSVVRFEGRVVVAAPIGDVFDRLTDLPGYRKWMHRTGLFRGCAWTEAGRPGVGTRYTDSTRMGTFHGEVAELDSPSRVEFRETLRWPGGARADARVDYALQPGRGETTVSHVAQTELSGWMRLLRPVASLMVRSERKLTLRSLARSFQ